MIQPILSSTKITLNSPGKINLHLAIGQKRADGFHELESIFAALDFADTLTFSLLPGNKAETQLILQEEGPYRKLSQKGQIFTLFPKENNIVYLAIELFRSKTGFSGNIRAELVKRIPPCSGLGGGSSNAAATLLALNNLLFSDTSPFSIEEMLDMAAQLGSDVPFFIEITRKNPKQSSTRAVKGRGEQFFFLPPLQSLGVLLVFPGFSSHTSPAFKLLDEKRLLSSEKQPSDFQFRLNNPWSPPNSWDFSNDFEKLFLDHGTEQEKNTYRTMLTDLKKAGAAFTGLSGSGSACFGIFDTPEDAKQAEKKLSGSFYALKSTFFLRNNKNQLYNIANRRG